LWLFPLGSLIIYFVKYHNIYSLKIKSKLGWLALFSSLSIVYAINSFNIITFAFSFSSFFIFLGFIAFFSYYSDSKHIFKYILSLILISQTVLIGILIISWRQPYRQYGPIWTYNTETQIPKGGYALKLYSEQSEFINNFYKISDQHGYITNTPIIDMTGSFLGAAYILNGYLPRTPWLYSGNPNSEAMVIAALRRLSCQELASAWLIIDPNFRRIFDPNVLLEAGLGDIKEYIFYGYAYFPVRTDDADIAYRPLGLISINGINKNVEICKAKRSQQHY
jgi:hypothetical protein